MRNVTGVLAVAVIAALTTASPGAADFDRPTKAVSAKVHLVRAFAPCTTPNDVHNGIAVLPACSPATPLSTYTFGTHTAKHHFCKTCGIHAFYEPRSHPGQIDVNVRCLDDPKDIARFAIEPFDGRNWEDNVEKIR